MRCDGSNNQCGCVFDQGLTKGLVSVGLHQAWVYLVKLESATGGLPFV